MRFRKLRIAWSVLFGEKLPEHWSKYLVSQLESGMGYQIARVTLDTGEVFDDVVILNSTKIAKVRGRIGVPFDLKAISTIEVTQNN